MIDLRKNAPPGSWLTIQSWRSLAFLHWKVETSELRRHVPQPLDIDMFEGTAWIGVVPFTMSISDRMGYFKHDFHELNVRTYVIYDGKPGVYFFSLDATSSLAVEGARLFYSLPYYKARIEMKTEDDGGTSYALVRKDSRGPAASFTARYKATGPAFTAQADTLEQFLTERYCLYTMRSGRLHRCDIHHSPWELRPADAEIEANTMCDGIQIRLLGAPHVLYSKSLDVLTSGLVAAKGSPIGGR